MAGRTRGKDSTDRTQRASKRQPAVWIFTEGTVTEPQYIDIVRGQRDPGVRIAVHIANDERTHGGTKGPKDTKHPRKPRDLLEAAIAKKREETRRAKKEKWPAPPKGTQWTTVWCVFDRDEHQGIDDVIRDARAEKIEVAYSHPCFELWRLLHYSDYTSTFGGICDDATKRLPFVTAGMSKAQAKIVLPEQVTGGYAKAKERAKRMNAQHGDHVRYENRDPYTDVWRFVEEGLHVTDY
jgi:hypothetical protein